MRTVESRVRLARLNQGVTQSELAHASGVSLPTIQLVESGRGNPSIETLLRLADALGLEIEVREKPADWDILVTLGAPLTRTGGSRRSSPNSLAPTSRELLRRQIILAALELQRDPTNSRRLEAWLALVLAIQHHYPRKFGRWFGRSSAVLSLLRETPLTGRIVKLKRIALARVAEYL